MAPAMRTCATTEERQTDLSEKLARAANLLRTRVDVEIERQNRDLLKSMNERTRLQLRLQTTVEGLSVAAVSYYVVGLFGYLVKGVHDEGVPVDISLATALFVPVAVLASGGWCGGSGASTSRGLSKTEVFSMRSERFEFPNAKGEKLAAALDLPLGEPAAYALFAHCFTCGKDNLAAKRIAERLSVHGIAMLRFDFTGLGGSEGEFANTHFSSNVDDLVAAADHLRKTKARRPF